MKTFPLAMSVAVWPDRALIMAPMGVNLLVAGSNSSAVANSRELLVPPAIQAKRGA
jgi:hypothetical protein